MNAKIGCLRINVKEWQRDAWNQAFNVCQSIIFRNACLWRTSAFPYDLAQGIIRGGLKTTRSRISNGFGESQIKAVTSI